MICLLRTDHAGRTDTFQVRKLSGWDGGLKVEASGKGLVGHAGAVLLHRTADRIDLVGRLRGGLRASPWLLDRADVLVSLVVGIALGAVNLAQAELLARHHAVLVGGQASDSTLWRALEEIDAKTREKIAKARARVRTRVWTLLEAREAGFPWIQVLGKELVGWVVIDMDATIITAASSKEQAAGTFKTTFGHHPLAAWCANTLDDAGRVPHPRPWSPVRSAQGFPNASDSGRHARACTARTASPPPGSHRLH
jgi:hypothetical protein